MKRKKIILMLMALMFGFGFLGIGCNGCGLSRYNINLITANSQAGTVSGGGAYSVGQNVEITANSTDKSSYQWLGWYYNGNLYTMDEKFEWKVQPKNVTFEAKWSNIIVNVYCYSNVDNNYASTSKDDIIMSFVNDSTHSNGVEYGKSVALYGDEIQNISGYRFLGWYSDKNLTKQITGPDGVIESSSFKEKTDLYAKWEVAQSYLTLTSNSELTTFEVYEKNDSRVYEKRDLNNLSFGYGAEVKVEMTNSGLTDGQNTFKEWNNNTNTSLYQDRTGYIIEFIMPDKDMEVNAIFTLPESGFEFDTTNSYAKLVQYFGNDETVIIPKTFGNKTVRVIGKNAFKKTNSKSIFITNSIDAIEDEAFYNVTSKIYFEDGVNYSNLISTNWFKLENEIYVDIRGGYNDYKLNRSSLIDGVCCMLDGVIADNIIDNSQEMKVLISYIYLYGINIELDVTLKAHISEGYVKEGFVNYYRSPIVINHTAAQNNRVTIGTSLNRNIASIDQFASVNTNEKFSEDVIEDPTLTSKVKMYKNMRTLQESYSKNPDPTRSVYIENANEYNICYNTEQLLYTIEGGRKPVFTDNTCIAKKVYDKALLILKTIIDDSMTETQKTLAIHDYVLSNCVPDDYAVYLRNNRGYTEPMFRSLFIEGVLLDGVAYNYTTFPVYTKVLSLLLNMEGIENTRYIGKRALEGGDETNYMWNKVSLDVNGEGKKWYNINMVMDEVLFNNDKTNEYEGITHKYFLVSDAGMAYSDKTKNYTFIVSNASFISDSDYSETYYHNAIFKYRELEFNLYFPVVDNNTDLSELGEKIRNFIAADQSNNEDDILFYCFELSVKGISDDSLNIVTNSIGVETDTEFATDMGQLHITDNNNITSIILVSFHIN